jgi:hypothetical protein
VQPRSNEQSRRGTSSALPPLLLHFPAKEGSAIPRTFAGFVPPLLAALALLPPGKALAGPPEGASGKLVLEAKKVRADGDLLIIRETAKGVLIEGPDYHGFATRITLDRQGKQLTLEGTQDHPARLWGRGCVLKMYQPRAFELEGVR